MQRSLFQPKWIRLVTAGVAALAAGCAPATLPPPAQAVAHMTPILPVTRLERGAILKALQADRATDTPSAALPEPSARPPHDLLATAPLLSEHDTLARDCREFRDRLGPEFIQGFVTVPEDWREPSGRRIRVFYYARLVRDEEGHVLRPVVFFNGGPGRDSHLGAEELEDRRQSAELSMIYLDQRGTGCSDPYPQEPIDLTTAQRLALYGSEAIVRDAEAVRVEILGVGSRWSVFGQSYGGTIVHRYLEMAPQSLRAAFAHGSAIVADPVDKVVGRLKAQLTIGNQYFASYPGDRARLAAIRSAIPEDHCFDDGVSRICGPAAIDSLAFVLGFRNQWPYLHEILGSVQTGDGAIAWPILDKVVRDFAFGIYGGDLASATLSYLEVTAGHTDASACQLALERMRDPVSFPPFPPAPPAPPGGSPVTSPFNECRLLGAIQSPWTAMLPDLGPGKPVSLERTAESLARHPALRFFLYSSGKDVFVPRSLFDAEVSHLGKRVTYRHFPSSGHEGYATEPQIWRDLRANSTSLE